MDKKTFINKVKDGAVKGMKNYGVLASLTIAQGILESGWGSSALSTKANNLFGIKANGNQPYVVMKTKEYVNGKWITVDAKFRKYDSWNDSIEDHAKFLVENKRYKNLIGKKDYKTVCKLIQQDGYATDPNYASSLITIIEQNKLNQYDGTSTDTPTPEPDKGNSIIRAGQVQANKYLGTNIDTDGVRGNATKKAGIKVLQKAMNSDYNAGLTVDGVWGAASEKALGKHYVKSGEKQYMVTAAEILLMLNGYDTGGVEYPGTFGNGLKSAVNSYKKAHGLSANGICDSATFLALIK